MQKEVSDPTLIQWSNLGVGKFSQFVRGLVVYLISIVIMAVSFGLIMWAIAYQKQLQRTGWK